MIPIEAKVAWLALSSQVLDRGQCRPLPSETFLSGLELHVDLYKNPRAAMAARAPFPSYKPEKKRKQIIIFFLRNVYLGELLGNNSINNYF